MPTPIALCDNSIDPFAHLGESQRVPISRVIYVTNREPADLAEGARYGSTPSRDLHIGVSQVQFGDERVTWGRLHDASRSEDRSPQIILRLTDVAEHGTMPRPNLESSVVLPDTVVEQIERELDAVSTRQIFIYVHGAKVNFTNSCVVTAELDHFCGRDFVSVAFSWATHQDIFAYMSGEDVRRANRAAHDLRALIEAISKQTSVEHINILGYSAGGRVVTHALSELGDAHAGLSSDELRERFRVGTVYLAAADVELEWFLDRVATMHALVDELVVTMSDADEALDMATLVMGGGQRVGSADTAAVELEIAAVTSLERVTLVDVSAFSNQRGFDIKGHHYWHHHTWASSDVVLAIRTPLGPQQRGLERSDDHDRVWGMPKDYPDRVRTSVKAALGTTWLIPTGP